MPLTLLHYAPDLWAPGGIAAYVRRLGAAQVRRGHRVRFATRTDRGDDAALDEALTDVVATDAEMFVLARACSVDVIHLHKPVDALPVDRIPTVRTMHGNQGSCPSGSRYLARTGQPCHRAYHPVGCTLGHLVDGCGSRRPHRILANLRNLSHEQAQAAAIPTLPVSHFVRDAMIRSGCAPDRLQVVPSPAPSPAVFVPPPTDGAAPRFVFLGRLAPQKGVDWLLEATAHVDGVQVDVAGTGDPDVEAALRRQVDALGLTDRVTFHGWLAPEDASALLRAARAVVVPSTWHEPAGLVTLEAAAHGRAVIASAAGGIPEYAHPDFSLLAPPRDVDALAAHLRTLAAHPDRAAAMGRRALHHAGTTFSESTFLNRLDAVYEAVLQDAGKASAMLPS